MRLLCVILIPSFLLMGCGLSQPALRLIDQTRQAGDIIAGDPNASPRTRQAGKDVAANSSEVQRETGRPEVSVPYSPAASAEDRQKHEEEQANPWWKLLLAAALTVATGAAGQQLATRILPQVFGGKVYSALRSTVEGIARLRDQHGPAGAIPIEGDNGLLSTLNDVQPEGVKNMITDIAHKEEARLLTKL